MGLVDIGSEFNSISIILLYPYLANECHKPSDADECRLKCNRSHPCENCIRRGDGPSCSYAAPGTRKKTQNQGSSSPDDMQNRIDRLEGLVLSLMTNGVQSAGPAAAVSAISRTQSDSAASSSFPLDPEDDDMIKEEDEGEGEDSEVEGVTNSIGVLKVDADKGNSMYFGDSHWHLVLADVSYLSIKTSCGSCVANLSRVCSMQDSFL